MKISWLSSAFEVDNMKPDLEIDGQDIAFFMPVDRTVGIS